MPLTIWWLMNFDSMYSLAHGQLLNAVFSVAQPPLPTMPIAATLLVKTIFSTPAAIAASIMERAPSTLIL